MTRQEAIYLSVKNVMTKDLIRTFRSIPCVPGPTLINQINCKFNEIICRELGKKNV